MKVVLFGDIHFGEKSNSDTHNKHCLDFLQFVNDWCDDNLTDDFTTIFLGDWFHNRNSINVKTLNYGKEGLIKLSNIGTEQYMLLGNHDLYYLDRRDNHSIIIPEEANGIEVIDTPIMVDDMLLCPWLLKDESLKELINEHQPNYVFGHFELPSFPLNQMVKFPGEFNPFEYEGVRRICSGHFHTHSEKGNITYIGNCFSHNFADKNDWHNKGFAVLDTKTNEIQYVEWKDAPKYCYTSVSELGNVKFENNMYMKILNDINLDQDNINKLCDGLMQSGNVVECHVITNELEINGETESVEVENLGNVNEIIPQLLQKAEIKNIDNQRLIKIFQNL